MYYPPSIMHDALVDSLWKQGKRESALDIQEDLVKNLAPNKGKAGSKAYFSAVNNLATLCNRDYQNVRAARLLRPALAALSSSAGSKLPPEYRDALDVDMRASLAGALFYLGRYAQAATLYEKLLINKNLQTDDNRDTLQTVKNNLALCYSKTGKLDKAKGMAEKNVQDATVALGADSTQALGALQILSDILTEQGVFAQALEIKESLVSRYEKTLGPEAAHTLNARLALAALYSQLGQYDVALTLNEELLPLMEKIFGKDHPSTLILLNNIGSIYSNRERDDFAKSRAMLQQVVEGSQKRLGTRHADTLRARINLARCELNMKQYAAARKAFETLLPEATRTLGPDSLDTLELRHNLAVLALEEGHAVEARTELTALLPLVQASGGGTLELITLNDLRRACQQAQDIVTAEFVGRQAVQLAQRMREDLKNAPQSVRAAFAQDRTPVYQGLADVLTAQGRVSEAQGVMTLLKQDELADLAPAQDKTLPPDMLASVDPTIIKRYADISGKLTTLGKELTELKEREAAGETLDAKEKARLAQIPKDMDTAHKTFAAFMGTLSSELGKKKPGAVPGLDQLKKYQEMLGKLGEGVALVQTIQSDKTLWLILTTQSAQMARQSPVDVTKLSADILRFRDILQDERQDARPLAQQFYKAIVEPLADDLQQAGATTLMFSHVQRCGTGQPERTAHGGEPRGRPRRHQGTQIRTG